MSEMWYYGVFPFAHILVLHLHAGETLLSLSKMISASEHAHQQQFYRNSCAAK
jgi:hypothetical protein